MKKSCILPYALIASLLFACGGGGESQSSSSSANSSSSGQTSSSAASSTQSSAASSSQSSAASSSQPSSSAASSSSSSIVSSESQAHVDNYERWIDSWSQPGHLYIHYLRPNASSADYDKYCLWVWQHAPQDLEGSLWGYSGETHVSDKLTLQPMSTDWMSKADVGKEGDGAWNDEYGRIMDIDLYNTNLVGGKSGEATSFVGATNVGFLVVSQSSMDGSSHWVSDGGKNTYIKDFDQHFRSTGAMHLFCVSGDLKNYTYESGQQEIRINPVTDDETGLYTSQTEDIVDTMWNTPTTSTADDFKSLGVGYQIMVSSFRDSDGDGLGDIRGIIDSLDYLQELGAQVLWLTPIQQSDSYHGYDISDYYAVDPKFGTTADYRELIYKAHQRGMKVLMDLVLNHTSKNNVWFEKSQWAVNSPNCETDSTGIEWRNVYSWKYKDDPILKYQNGSYQTITVEEDAHSENPSWYRDGESNYYYYGKFGSGMPEINYEYQPTRDLVKDMARYWLSFGLDGYRLDAVKHIYMKDEVADTGTDVIITDTGSKRSYDDEKGVYVTKDFDYSSDLNKNVTWWKEFANDLKGAYPNCFLVGENFDGWGKRIAPYYNAMDSQFDFANYFHIVQYLYADPAHGGTNGGGSAYAYKEPNETINMFTTSTNQVLDGTSITVPGGRRPDFINGAFTSNHDVPRAINQVNGTWASPTDTVASPLITGTAQEIGRAKVHAAITMLTPGVSWIYYGDELGMSGNTDSHIEKYGNENSMDIWYRQPMKWEKTAVAGTTDFKAGQYTFEWDNYNLNLDGVKEQKLDSGSMYSWYKALNDIKKQYPKNAQVEMSGGTDVLVFKITGEGATWKIFINCGYSASEDYIINPDGLTAYESPVLANGATASNFGRKAFSVLAYKG